MTSHQCWLSSWTRSTVSTTLMWCNVDEIQNSAVSFLTYSFSDSFFLRFRNSYNYRAMRPQARTTTHNTAAHLDGVQLLGVLPVPLVSKTNDRRRALPNSHPVTDSVLLEQANRARAGF